MNARLAALVLFTSTALTGQNPRQIGNINPSLRVTVGSSLSYATRQSDNLIFLTCSAEGIGEELFACNGNSIRLVKDIRPGAGSSSPSNLTVVGDVLYFSCEDGIHGRELWRSDGTATGTVLVSDIKPGAQGSDPAGLTDHGGRLVYCADNGWNGKELWSLDPDGASLIADINPGRSSSSPSFLRSIGTRLYFAADNGTSGSEPWVMTNGSPRRLNDIHPGAGDSFPRFFTEVNGWVYFIARSSGGASELWRTNGSSSSTAIVKGILGGGSPSHLTAVGNILLFTALGFDSGHELWRSDGTTSGTHMVRDINPGILSSQPSGLVAVGNTVFFRATTPAAGYELWKSDGTAPGTVLVKDIHAGPTGAGVLNLTRVGNFVYFLADHPAYGGELWRSDGTSSGTALVRDLRIGPEGSIPRGLYANGDRLYFYPSSGSSHERVLYSTTGSTRSTQRVDSESSVSSFPSELVALGDEILFRADDKVRGVELWKRTSTGVELVKDIDPGPVGGFPMSLCRLGSRILFSARDAASGRELWESDGTASGTRLLADLAPGGADSSPNSITRVGERVVFATCRGSSPNFTLELRIGSTTFPVIHQSGAGSMPWHPFFAPVANGGSFVFAGFGDTELWISDGTSAGTKELKDIHATGNSEPKHMTPFGDKVLFSANTAAHGRELWITDGTASGTVLLKDIDPGNASSSPFSFAPRHDVCFFVAKSDTLYKTDGTTAGTVAIKDFDRPIDGVTVVGSRKLVLRGGDATNGAELWVSDGTEAGTRIVADIRPGSEDGMPVARLAAVDEVVFAATDGKRGIEPWSYVPGATTWHGGDGCGTATRMPRLDATDPVLGTTQRITSRDVKSGSIGTLLLGFDGSQVLASGARSGCTRGSRGSSSTCGCKGAATT